MTAMRIAVVPVSRWSNYDLAGLQQRQALLALDPLTDVLQAASLKRAAVPNIDRQIQLDQARLQQRHRQVVLQLDPSVVVAQTPAELLEYDLTSLLELGVRAEPRSRLFSRWNAFTCGLSKLSQAF
jgi:hypothetical protein